MSQCEHKTEAEYGVCNRCTTFANIARAAKRMLDARNKYMGLLLASPTDSDEAQYDLQNRVKELEAAVRMADLGNLWNE